MSGLDVTPQTISLWRRRWYAVPGRQHRLRRPVISIGNLSVGGRGKTPVTALVARMLIEAGERPAILSRGYRRRRPVEGVVVVSDGRHLLADVDCSGDEPLMLARAVRRACVLVCEQRAIAGALAERALGATVHVLDDGFQHLTLARDIDIVIVGESDFADRPLPFGRLREPIHALAMGADAIIGERHATPAIGAWRRGLDLGSGVPETFVLDRTLEDPVPLEPDRRWEAVDRRVVALAGIARPARFDEALTARGWTVVDRVHVADHHRYSTTDLARIAAVAMRARAPVVTTEKDAIRLLAMRPLPVAIASVPLVVTVEPRDAFRTWLFDRLAEARA